MEQPQRLPRRAFRCGRCGHGFIGTVGHGKGGAYRYYAGYSRRRQGRAACDQELIPADRLEERVLAAALSDLNYGTLFREAAERARREWQERNCGSSREIERLQKKIDDRRRALDRFLKAFESGQLGEATCAYRVKEIEKELPVLEAEVATLEAGREAPALSDQLSEDLSSQIEAAVRTGTPHLKSLLARFVDSIVVESRKFAQPFYFMPGVRVVFGQRTRIEHKANRFVFPGEKVWLEVNTPLHSAPKQAE